MPTENRRVATYLPKKLDECLKAFVVQKELKGSSSALIIILSEYFGLSEYSGATRQVAYQGDSDLLLRLEALENKFQSLKYELLNELKSELLGLAAEASQTDILKDEEEAVSVQQGEIFSDVELNSLMIHSVDELKGELQSEPEEESQIAEVHTAPVACDLSCRPAREFLKGLSGRGLENRLMVSHGKFHGAKSKPDFSAWIRSEDPDCWDWLYDKENKKYFPVVQGVPTVLTLSSEV